MFQRYGVVLAVPGAIRFTLAGAIGRLPLSMAGLGIVLLMKEISGSYATAGLIAAAYMLTSAVFAPFQGRLADLLGQAPILVAASLIFVTGIVLMMASIHRSPLTLGLCAALAGVGASQSGNFARSRWTYVLDGRDQLGTAFALEAVLDETVFIIGPVLVTFLTLSVAPSSGLLVAAACSLLGSFLMATGRDTQPPRSLGEEVAREKIAPTRLVPLVIVALSLGVLFGSSEVIVVAFTDQLERPEAAGWVLAVWATGSLLAGLLVGSRAAPPDPLRRLRLSTLLLALLFIPLLLAPNLLFLTLGMLLAGFMIAPTLIATIGLVETTTPSARLTEALTWTSTGLAVGIAPGAALAGWLVEHNDAAVGFAVPIAAGISATIVVHFYRFDVASLVTSRDHRQS